MRILHILDHSIPLHSGYTFRTAAILREQRALDWETFHLTSPKQGKAAADFEDVDGLRFFRTPVPLPSLPILNELSQIKATEIRLDLA
jgi:glycogen synthase